MRESDLYLTYFRLSLLFNPFLPSVPLPQVVLVHGVRGEGIERGMEELGWWVPSTLPTLSSPPLCLSLHVVEAEGGGGGGRKRWGERGKEESVAWIPFL